MDTTEAATVLKTPNQSESDRVRLFDALVASRRSIRAFENRAIPSSVVADILRVASRAPSNSNTQPWKVDVLMGAAKASLTRAVVAAHQRDPRMPTEHFPAPLPDEHRARQLAFGALFYEAYGIGRGDEQGVARMLASNYDFFGAPVGLIVSTDRQLRAHSWLDCGLFLQTLMLAARARGLATCPQVVFAKHHATISRELALPDDRIVVCGVSLGFSVDDAVVNNVDYPRAPVAEFARFHDCDG